jgi:hypothetical protein
MRRRKKGERVGPVGICILEEENEEGVCACVRRWKGGVRTQFVPRGPGGACGPKTQFFCVRLLCLVFCVHVLCREARGVCGPKTQFVPRGPGGACGPKTQFVPRGPKVCIM